MYDYNNSFKNGFIYRNKGEKTSKKVNAIIIRTRKLFTRKAIHSKAISK